MRLSLFAALLLGSTASGQSPEFSVGPTTFRPGGFLELISEYRSRAINGTVSTPFASLPLDDVPGEYATSLAHSRVNLHAQTPIENARVVVYLEADLLQTPGRAPWRWRQYWAEISAGPWHISGGQSWSLLRPNRKGISSESDLMNTLALEPSYHIGLVGDRRHALRLTRDIGSSTAVAVEWATRGEFTAKLAHDARRGHFEVMGAGGTHGRAGFGFAQVIRAAPRLDIVGQQFWSRGFGKQVLGIFPAGVRTLSTIEGLEVHATKRLKVFGYGGIVYGTRSAGNRREREWSAGALHRVYSNPYGTMQVGVQFSQLDRDVWTGRQGSMWYWMTSARWVVPAR